MSRPQLLDPLQDLDTSPVTRQHWRTVITTGMGFFTDAYDLFVIGTVTVLLQSLWHITTWQLSLMNSVSLLSAATGSVLFGSIMDRLGRRKIYGLEALLMIGGSLLSALSPNYAWLIVSRFIVGIGIGGDYPASAVIVSEFATKSNRGRLVTYVFAMQGIGLVAGPLVSLIGLDAHCPAPILWRLLLAQGAIPAAFALYFRRQMPETPRFMLHVKHDPLQTRQIIHTVTGQTVDVRTFLHTPHTGMLRQQPFLRRLIATSLAWFFLDAIFYGLSISSHVVLHHFVPHASLETTTRDALIIFVVSALPGYYGAAAKMDQWGRRKIQWVGFGALAIIYGLIAVFDHRMMDAWGLLLLYGLGYFFIELGPNTTTFLYPSEIFPTHLRGRGHGLAAAAGKVGAFVATFCLPLVAQTYGVAWVFFLLSLAAVFGIIVTIAWLPEPRNRALEELNGYLQTDSVHHTYSRIIEALHEDQVEDAIVSEMLTLSGSELVTIHHFDEDTMTLVPTQWNGLYRPDDMLVKDALTLPLYRDDQGRGLNAPQPNTLTHSFTQAIIVVDNDLTRSQDNAALSHAFPAMRSIASFPLLHRHRPTGLITFWDRDAMAFSEKRISQLRMFVQVAAIALAQAQQFTAMRYLAFTDGLTQLPNRMGLEREIERRFAQAKAFAFVIMDLDGFKQHNDTFGHQSGDQALQTIATHLRKAIEAGDAVARLGGDEFILLLGGVTSASGTYRRFLDIAGALPLEAFGLGVSAGSCLYPEDGQTYQDLYRVADRRLYAAKQQGRGRLITADDASMENPSLPSGRRR